MNKDPTLRYRFASKKSNCKHCGGRLYVGTDIVTGKKVLCKCTKITLISQEEYDKLDKRDKDGTTKNTTMS